MPGQMPGQMRRRRSWRPGRGRPGLLPDGAGPGPGPGPGPPAGSSSLSLVWGGKGERGTGGRGGRGGPEGAWAERPNVPCAVGSFFLGPLHEPACEIRPARGEGRGGEGRGEGGGGGGGRRWEGRGSRFPSLLCVCLSLSLSGLGGSGVPMTVGRRGRGERGGGGGGRRFVPGGAVAGRLSGCLASGFESIFKPASMCDLRERG